MHDVSTTYFLMSVTVLIEIQNDERAKKVRKEISIIKCIQNEIIIGMRRHDLRYHMKDQ